MSKKRRKGKRGHAVAVIAGFSAMDAHVWILYDEQFQLKTTVKLGRKHENADKSQLYRFHENVVNAIRPVLRSGLKSLLLISPPKTEYASLFHDHVRAHHQWMVQEKSPNSAVINELEGRASSRDGMAFLIGTEPFKKILGVTTGEEADQVIATLEHRLNDDEEGLVLYSLQDIEQLIYAGGTRKKKYTPLPLVPEYIILTDKFLNEQSNKNRVQRLLAIAKNRGIKTRILDGTAQAGKRITEFGGIVCFLRMETEQEKLTGKRMFG